ncbi:MAG: NADP-dependent oxidoreductase [Actinomycetota bacterium]
MTTSEASTLGNRRLNKSVVLKRRPIGAPAPEDFETVVGIREPVSESHVEVENLAVSLDAGFRHWMDEGSGDHVLPAMELGQPVMGLVLSRVIESRHRAYEVGDVIVSRLSWQEYSQFNGDSHHVKIHVDETLGLDLGVHLGILGDTGLSAYFGLFDHGQPAEGETVLISAAAGAVGNVVGQLAKIRGCRVIGIVGDDSKAKLLRGTLGFDGCINRHGDIDSQLQALCPTGVDIYFDNVGGPILETVLDHLALHARIVLCGAVATYNSASTLPGPSNLFNLVTQQATMAGFLTHQSQDRYQEARDRIVSWIRSGELMNIEHRLFGVENTGQAFCDMFAGKNFGKTVVELRPTAPRTP